jgi:siroheme synthase (precorrin-2 oxidase/ferrochelatase)
MVAQTGPTMTGAEQSMGKMNKTSCRKSLIRTRFWSQIEDRPRCNARCMVGVYKCIPLRSTA